MDKGIEKHSAIEKALEILGLFAINNPELSTIEISRMLGYHRATASRILLLLKKYEFLEQNEQTKKFKLGTALIDLGVSVNRSLKNSLVQLAKPYLDNLRDTLQETVGLEVLSGTNTVLAYVAEGLRRIRLGAEVGMLVPTNVSAGAKAILAFTSPEQWDTFLESDHIRFNPNSISYRNRFHNQLKQIKKTRIAFDIGEYDPALNAIGSPVFNIEGTAIAAVVVVGMAKRIGNKLNSKAADEVKKTAERISEQLYYIDHTPGSLYDWLELIKVED